MRKPDQKRPVVCFDESPRQLIDEVRRSIPAKAGELERHDCECKRNGTVGLFIFLDARGGPWRKVNVVDSPRSASPPACATLATVTSQRQSASGPCWTICPPTPSARFTKLSCRPKRAAYCVGSSSTTSQACQLAEHGRDRDWRAAQPVPRSADPMDRTHPVRGGAWERQCNASRARIKWTFTTEKARAKAGALTSAGLRPKRHNHRAKNQSLSPPPLVCTH